MYISKSPDSEKLYWKLVNSKRLYKRFL